MVEVVQMVECQAKYVQKHNGICLLVDSVLLPSLGSIHFYTTVLQYYYHSTQLTIVYTHIMMCSLYQCNYT